MTLTADTVPVAVEWHKFVVGSSFYIPCLDRQGIADQITASANERGMNIKFRFVLENGTQGVRFWRIT
jgi:hypothetical protein